MKPAPHIEKPRYLWSRTLGLACALVVATLAIYSQVWRFEFISFDDPLYVSENPRVLEGLTRSNLAWCFRIQADGNWLPLTWLSLMIDADFFGRFAGGYHLTNVLLHVVNTLLLFALLSSATGMPQRSAFVAALFALHPLHVESVAWIAERKDVLSILFGLASLLAYVHYARVGRYRVLAASFVLFVASLLSKATLVTLPFVLILFDFWPLQRFEFGPSFKVRALFEKVPFLAASCAVSIVTVVAQTHSRAMRPLATYPMANRLLNAVVAYADYLRQTVFPENLSVYYPHPGVALTWTAAIVPAIVMVALTLLAIIFRRRRPYLLFGWLWFVGTLVPMIGLVQVGNQQRADRYTYFPLIGVFIAATWFVSDFAQRSALGRRITPVFAFGVLALLGVTAFVQIGYWHDSVRLTRHALACGEDSTTVRIALATGLLARGETTEAIDLLESAVHMDPRDAEARFNLGVGLEAIGRPTDAASQYEAALAIDERDPRSHNNLGAIYWKQHQYANAKQHFFRALQIDPDHVRTYVNLGSLDVETGDYAQAIAASRRALQLDPHLLRCHHNIAMALLAQGYITQAIGELRYILSVAPEDAEAQAKLKMTLAIQRQNPGH